MYNINRVIIAGHVTQEPITKSIDGTSKILCKFTLATNGRRSNGDNHLNVEFHSIVCLDQLAEVCNEMGDDEAFDDETWQGQANRLLSESLQVLTEK